MILKNLIALVLSLTPILGFTQSISVATSPWAPYIHAEHKTLGTAADILKQVLSQDNYTIDWQYQNYDLAFELVAKHKQDAAFPYFKNKERAQRVLYSESVFSVVNHIYYNRQQESKLDLSQLNQHKFGRVAGYSYGKTIDRYLVNSRTFSSEKHAIESLFNNEIDFLPMTESVMNTLLNKTYQDQALLIKQVTNVIGYDTLHVIAPKTHQGSELIAKVNALLQEAKGIKSLQPTPVQRFKPKDIARLTIAEGHPAIVGQTTLSKNAEYYTLPKGTRVIILEWSDKIIRPSNTDRIYKSMIDLSKVVILNGPHVGKELYIKNMHLEVQ